MFNMSTTATAHWTAVPVRSPSPTLNGDALSMLALRFIAHLPYFKIASALMLPQGLSNAGVVVTTLVYALACFVASRWCAEQRRSAADLPHAAVLPLLGATSILITMMVVGPVLATLLPRHPERAADLLTMLPAWAGL